MSEIDLLLARAFDRGPAVGANRQIDRVRGDVEQRLGRAHNYEVVLVGPGLEPRGRAYLLETVAPRLALYLRAKRMRVADCRGVFLSVFVDDTIHFIEAEAFFDYVRIALGVSEETFGEVASGWERSGRAAAGLLSSAGN